MFKHMVKCVPLALLAFAGPVSAQVWDTPSFFSPRPGNDIGIYVVDPEGDDNLGIQGIWRQEGNLGLGVRAGIGEDVFIAGAELHNPLNLAGTSPLLMSWVTGIGASFAENVTYLRIPLGVSIGAEFGNSIKVMPYVHPRIAFDLVAFDEDLGLEDDTDSELNFDLDLGVDVAVTPRLTAKFGATVTDRDAVGLGISYRLGRRVVVR